MTETTISPFDQDHVVEGFKIRQYLANDQCAQQDCGDVRVLFAWYDTPQVCCPRFYEAVFGASPYEIGSTVFVSLKSADVGGHPACDGCGYKRHPGVGCSCINCGWSNPAEIDRFQPVKPVRPAGHPAGRHTPRSIS